MKAIIENNTTYKVTGERGDFTICENVNGKIKMFQTSSIEIVEIETMPKAKVFKKSKPVSNSAHLAFKNKMREAEFQENYFEIQRANKY
jgi:hypothetical protein